MTSDSTAIKITNLSKRYTGGLWGKSVLAIANLDLEIQRGEVFGLLGPNGAGKTTLVKILLGSLRATSGSAAINGYDIRNWRSRAKVGFLPENHRFPSYLTGRQLLHCFGGMSGFSRRQIITRKEALLQLVGMSEWQSMKIKKYSKGMMQRLGLAQAILNDPDTIFLDEPTDGVDPVGRHDIRTILLDLKKQGKTIFLNSHLLSEVEAICDRVAVLDKGKLLKVGPVQGLVDARPVYRVETAGLKPETTEMLKQRFPQADIAANVISITLNDARQINELVDLLRQQNVELTSVIPVKMNLEESFLELIKGGTRE